MCEGNNAIDKRDTPHGHVHLWSDHDGCTVCQHSPTVIGADAERDVYTYLCCLSSVCSTCLDKKHPKKCDDMRQEHSIWDESVNPAVLRTGPEYKCPHGCHRDNAVRPVKNGKLKQLYEESSRAVSSLVSDLRSVAGRVDRIGAPPPYPLCTSLPSLQLMIISPL